MDHPFIKGFGYTALMMLILMAVFAVMSFLFMCIGFWAWLIIVPVIGGLINCIKEDEEEEIDEKSNSIRY